MAALTAGLAVLVASGVAGSPARACEARIELSPSEAWVGEQVLHEIVIEGVAHGATVEWLQPPAFDDARARLLPPAPGDRDDPPDTRRQRRALHPVRAGRLELSPTPFRCATAKSGEVVERSTPAITLVVESPPRAGRPERWRGLVGAVTLQVQASPARTRVGETARLVATLSGPGLLRHAAFTWPHAELSASPVAPELFEGIARHHEQPGLRLVSRRVETLEVVPHAAGELWVPAIEVEYWDPEAQRFAEVASEPFAIEVEAEQIGAPQRVGSGDEPSRDGAHPRHDRGTGWRGLFVAAVGLGVIALALGARSRARRLGR